MAFAAVSAFAQTPLPTPLLYSEKTLSDLTTLQKTAVASDYAYRQVGYLANNIGPRLSGSAQAARGYNLPYLGKRNMSLLFSKNRSFKRMVVRVTRSRSFSRTAAFS